MFRSTSAITPLNVLGDRVTPWFTGEDTAGAYELFELEGPAAAGPPPHFHPWQEAYVVLDGEVDLQIGDRNVRAVAGDVANVPVGTVHTFRIVSETARFLVLTTGDEARRFFGDISEQVHDVAHDLPKVLEIAAAHGVTPVLPTSA